MAKPDELRAAALRVDSIEPAYASEKNDRALDACAAAARRLADVIEQLDEYLAAGPSGWGEDYDRGYDVAASAVLRLARGEGA